MIEEIGQNTFLRCTLADYAMRVQAGDESTWEFETLTIDSFGGDVARYLDAPPSMRNLVGEIARTRWVSAERTSDKVIAALDEPASQLLIDKISNFLVEWSQRNGKKVVNTALVCQVISYPTLCLHSGGLPIIPLGVKKGWG